MRKTTAVLVALLLLTTTCQAQWLPWRRQTEQRLHHQERLIEILLQKQTPQTLPGPGTPQQTLPIPGTPQQILPIPGVPRQELPQAGPPQQELPQNGPPQQELPQDLPPQQSLPTAPQAYTRRFVPALYFGGFR